MRNIIVKYRKWKKEVKNKGCRNDKIYQFMTDELTNGEILSIFEYLDNELARQEYQKTLLDIANGVKNEGELPRLKS